MPGRELLINNFGSPSAATSGSLKVPHLQYVFKQLHPSINTVGMSCHYAAQEGRGFCVLRWMF